MKNGCHNLARCYCYLDPAPVDRRQGTSVSWLIKPWRPNKISQRIRLDSIMSLNNRYKRLRAHVGYSAYCWVNKTKTSFSKIPSSCHCLTLSWTNIGLGCIFPHFSAASSCIGFVTIDQSGKLPFPPFSSPVPSDRKKQMETRKQNHRVGFLRSLRIWARNNRGLSFDYNRWLLRSFVVRPLRTGTTNL